MSYWYLGSPYSLFPDGMDAAWQLACREAGRLAAARIPAYSPVAHSHPCALAAGLDPLDHELWMALDEPMMAAARGLVVLMAEGWESSKGVALEIAAFEAAGKPIHWMRPGAIPMELLEEVAGG